MAGACEYGNEFSGSITAFFLQHRSGRKQLTVRESPFTKLAQTAWYAPADGPVRSETL
jgi:hypothetical protein